MGALGNNTRITFCALLRLLSWCFWLQTSCGFLFPATPSATRPPPFATSIPPIASAAVASKTDAEAGAGAVSGNTASKTDDDSVAPRTAVPAAAGVSSEFQDFVELRNSVTRRVVLDLRPGVDFRRRHLEGSTSIPMDELEPRLLELPPPFAQPVSIVGREEVRMHDMNCAPWSGLQRT